MRRLIGVTFVFTIFLALADAQVPQPFPRPQSPSGPGRPAPSTPPSDPAPVRPAAPAPAKNPTAEEAVPTEATLGFPIYPNAQFVVSYDAGHGQRYYLFGSDAGFSTLVKYYQTVFKTRGTLVFDAPGTHIFEIGRFDERTMAYPPGVTIKDYMWNGGAGYLNPKRGAKPERFASIIQIVP